MNQAFLFGLYLSLMFAVAAAIAYQFSETVMWGSFLSDRGDSIGHRPVEGGGR